MPPTARGRKRPANGPVDLCSAQPAVAGHEQAGVSEYKNNKIFIDGFAAASAAASSAPLPNASAT